MNRIVWSRLSRDYLEEIRLYLKVRDPHAARRVVVAIRDQTRRLRDFPLSGAPFGTANFRKLSVMALPYVVIYRVETTVVEISRVIHSARDFSGV